MDTIKIWYIIEHRANPTTIEKMLFFCFKSWKQCFYKTEKFTETLCKNIDNCTKTPCMFSNEVHCSLWQECKQAQSRNFKRVLLNRTLQFYAYSVDFNQKTRRE